MNDISYYKQQRKEIIHFILGHPRRILDIGCATGMFRTNISWPNEYWGVEYVPEVAELAKENLDHVLAGEFETVHAQLPKGYFDLIVCNDVLEHIVDTNGFLKSVSEHLAPNGQLVGSVPNVRFIMTLVGLVFMGDWKYTDAGILDKDHVRFFTKKSLTRAFLVNGYKIDTVRHINVIGHNQKFSRTLGSVCRFCIGLIVGRSALYWQIGFRIRKHSAL